MRIFLKFILPLFLWGIFACQEQVIKEERFPGGQLKKSWSLKKNSNGKYIKDGITRTWYPNGNLESEFSYKNGQMEGIAQTWYLNGQIQFDGNYREGYLVRESRWDEEGAPIFSREYTLVSHYFENLGPKNEAPLKEKYTVLKRDNNSLIKHGTYRSWFANGQLEKIIEYSEGEKDGFAKEWYPTGKLKSQGHFLQNKKEGPWSYAYETGKIKYKILYRNNLKDGPFTWWYPSGKKKEESEFTNDSLNGEFTSWYEDGSPKEKKVFVSGVQSGKASTWYTNGNLHREEIWRNGLLQDSVVEWFENGQLKSNMQYTKGQLHGISKLWHGTGKLFIESRYESGKLQGDYKWWTEKGDLISTQKYSKGILVFDSRVAKMKKVLEATEIDIPIRFMGFQWGMNADEVITNIKKLQGTVTKQLPEDITFSLPAKRGASTAQIMGKIRFNNWGELWNIKLDFPNEDQIKFSQFSDFIEHELRFKLGLPKFTKDFKDLPGMLEKERTWGTLFVESKRPPHYKNQYPTIKAHLLGYKNQKWITLELENYLIREYAAENDIQLSGPFYDAVSN